MYYFLANQNLFDYYNFYKNLEDDIIYQIFEIVSQLNFEESSTASQKKTTRKSQIKWIHSSKKTNFLFSFLENLVNQANLSHFNFDIISTSESLQYTEYKGSDYGQYKWHIDSFEPAAPPYRKLSLTIQLSDPNEYEGGDLEISIPQPEKNLILKAPKEKGKIIVFPSYLYHRITPVTKGTRKSLVWWVGGTPFR